MDSKLDQVTTYGLYGEDKFDLDGAFLHIEQISSRSSLYDWEIKPHSHSGMFQLLFLNEGSAEVQLDQLKEVTHAPAVICTPGNIVHGFMFMPETEGWVVTVSEATLTSSVDPRLRDLINPFLDGPMVLPMTDKTDVAIRLEAMLEALHEEFKWPATGREAVLEWTLQIILVTVLRHAEGKSREATQQSTYRDLFDRFRKMLEDRYKEHWTVEDYANSLGTTAAQLNRACRSVADKATGVFIQDRLALEAQRLLIYTNATASMIAFELGFKDPAYFARFFKRRTLKAPMEFRKHETSQSH